jgi:hypothetical protein
MLRQALLLLLMAAVVIFCFAANWGWFWCGWFKPGGC